MKIMPNSEELVLKGIFFLESGDFDKALSFFEQALLLDSSNPDLWNYKGTALRSLGRYGESMECFNNSLKIDPRDKFAS